MYAIYFNLQFRKPCALFLLCHFVFIMKLYSQGIHVMSSQLTSSIPTYIASISCVTLVTIIQPNNVHGQKLLISLV
jgi:hypothetical protein